MEKINYSSKIKPVIEVVNTTRKALNVALCGICGNQIDPHTKRDFCRYCRYSIDWTDVKELGIVISSNEALTRRIY